MKMKLILSYFLILTFSSTSAGFLVKNSSFNNEKIQEVKPPYIPEPTPDEPKNIKSISILNIPQEGIKIGYFNDANIEYRFDYTDNTYEVFPFKESNCSDDFRYNVLGTVGTHKIKLLVRGVEVSFVLKMLETDKIYDVTLYDFDDTVISTQQVKYDQRPVFPETNPYRPQDANYRYTFKERDYTGPIDDESPKEIRAKYNKTLKHRDFVQTMENSFVYKNSNEILVYLGRYYKVPVYTSSSVYRNLNEKAYINYDMSTFDETIQETYLNRIFTSFSHLYKFTNDEEIECEGFESYEIDSSRLSFGNNYDSKVYQTKDTEFVKTASSNYEDYFYNLAGTSESEGTFELDELYNGGISGYYSMSLFMNFDVFAKISYTYSSLLDKYTFNLETINMAYSDAFYGLNYLGNRDRELGYSSLYKIEINTTNLLGMMS